MARSVPWHTILISVDGYWLAWSNWTECSTTCAEGTQVRNRECVEPLHDGITCQGTADETKDCFLRHCPGIIKESIRNLGRVLYLNAIIKLKQLRSVQTHAFFRLFFSGDVCWNCFKRQIFVLNKYTCIPMLRNILLLQLIKHGNCMIETRPDLRIWSSEVEKMTYYYN